MSKIKRIINIALLIVICLTFVSCRNADNINKNDINTDNSEEVVEVDNFEEALYNKVKSEILKWDEKDIYAISFFLHSNEANEYKGFKNVTTWAVSYNTEADCQGASLFDEERWNYAFWRQDETMIIDFDTPNQYADALFDWYAQKGVVNIGEENEAEMYDEKGNYVGKGPAGHYELLQFASSVAEKLQRDGTIKEHFGKEIPIIIHDLEYSWYDFEATKNANPNNQADAFFEAMEEPGAC
ncbi:MAG: hypothetical protein ACI4VI_07700 [Acutalibacteraceae bacterium]